MKDRAAAYYKGTFDQIRKNLAQGPLIHADETRIGLKGKASYVWVFASMEEVVYIWSASREADTPQQFLRDFKGVLVSDFFSAYTSIGCARQKCLIHLLRDLNESIRKEPFNEELRLLTQQFAALLQPIMATIDRFGLKARFLGKHERHRAILWVRTQRRVEDPLGAQAADAARTQCGYAVHVYRTRQRSLE
jgi:hypothetical protein